MWCSEAVLGFCPGFCLSGFSVILSRVNALMTSYCKKHYKLLYCGFFHYLFIFMSLSQPLIFFYVTSQLQHKEKSDSTYCGLTHLQMHFFKKVQWNRKLVRGRHGECSSKVLLLMESSRLKYIDMMWLDFHVHGNSCHQRYFDFDTGDVMWQSWRTTSVAKEGKDGWTRVRTLVWVLGN